MTTLGRDEITGKMVTLKKRANIYFEIYSKGLFEVFWMFCLDQITSDSLHVLGTVYNPAD